MPQLKIMNAREMKEMANILERQHGFRQKLEYVFAINQKSRIYAINKEIFEINIGKIKLNSLGLYFAELNGDEIRLSIEGSQIVGKDAAENVAELNGEEALRWFRGEDLEKETGCKGLVILKHGDDFLGTGKSNGGRIFNFVGKARRINSS